MGGDDLLENDGDGASAILEHARHGVSDTRSEVCCTVGERPIEAIGGGHDRVDCLALTLGIANGAETIGDFIQLPLGRASASASGNPIPHLLQYSLLGVTQTGAGVGSTTRQCAVEVV